MRVAVILVSAVQARRLNMSGALGPGSTAYYYGEPELVFISENFDDVCILDPPVCDEEIRWLNETVLTQLKQPSKLNKRRLQETLTTA